MATQACTCLYFKDGPKAVEWLTKAAQFETIVRYDSTDGARVEHCEMNLGPVVIMVGSVKEDKGMTTPTDAGGRTGSIYVVMKDTDALKAHFEHAKAVAPLTIQKEPYTTDYGSLDYSLEYEGQVLYFGTYAPAIKN